MAAAVLLAGCYAPGPADCEPIPASAEFGPIEDYVTTCPDFGAEIPTGGHDLPDCGPWLHGRSSLAECEASGWSICTQGATRTSYYTRDESGRVVVYADYTRTQDGCRISYTRHAVSED